MLNTELHEFFRPRNLSIFITQNVTDRHTDGDQKRIIIETGSESQKYGIEISIQLDMERSIQGCMETDITK